MRGGGTGPAQAERYASTLDGLDASANVQKAQAHARLGPASAAALSREPVPA